MEKDGSMYNFTKIHCKQCDYVAEKQLTRAKLKYRAHVRKQPIVFCLFLKGFLSCLNNFRPQCILVKCISAIFFIIVNSILLKKCCYKMFDMPYQKNTLAIYTINVMKMCIISQECNYVASCEKKYLMENQLPGPLGDTNLSYITLIMHTKETFTKSHKQKLVFLFISCPENILITITQIGWS